MRDPEAAEAVDFTVHAGENNCITGDTCKGQKDPISNLTQAISADIFRVEFHAATSKAKPLAGFIQEVQCIQSGFSRPTRTDESSPAAAYELVPCTFCALCVRVLAVQKLQKGDPVIFVWTAPHAWIDKHVTRMRRVDISSYAAAYYVTVLAKRLAPRFASVCVYGNVYVCMQACVCVCVRSCSCACVLVAAASTAPTDL